MTWKEWLGYGIYKKLWSLIGKRPWTYIRRDFYHIAPILNIGFFFWAGVFFGLNYFKILAWLFSNPWHFLIVSPIIWLIGGLQCHFFWGTKYIPDQKGGKEQ